VRSERSGLRLFGVRAKAAIVDIQLVNAQAIMRSVMPATRAALAMLPREV